MDGDSGDDGRDKLSMRRVGRRVIRMRLMARNEVGVDSKGNRFPLPVNTGTSFH